MPARSGARPRLSPEAIWERISLRRDDRALLIGGTRSGKSTLGDYLGQAFVTKYRSLGARRMINDTKPRFRAEWLPNGTTAKRRYKNWSHGQYVPDSVLVSSPGQLKQAWQTDHRTVIVQAEFGAEIPMQVACLTQFLRESQHKRPQLAHIDEALDFFFANGSPKYTDTVIRLPRAGAERGTASLFCSQRTKGFSPAMLELMNVLYAFRLDFESDAQRFQEFGCPLFALPEEDHEFAVWSKADRRHVYGPYRLTI